MAARGLLTPAAEAGDAESQYTLGLISPDPNRAAQWMIRAANQGHCEAQYMLGLMYSKGSGVHVDDALAYFWFSLAAKTLKGD
jgi:TPR repeat protein